MGKSFFRGTDAEVYTGSAHFSARISATPEAFGLDASRAEAYALLNASYAAAYLAAVDPSRRTRGTVVAKNDAKARLTAMASDLAKAVAAAATVTDAQKVGLGLSVRARPTPMPRPGTPTGFKVTLSADGSVTLAWACDNPPRARGTMYEVRRRVGPAGEFQYLGVTGKRRFVDATLPAGSGGATYQVRAFRSTSFGPWAQFNLTVGTTAPAGGATPKIAA
jgi:hypothetical protein